MSEKAEAEGRGVPVAGQAERDGQCGGMISFAFSD